MKHLARMVALIAVVALIGCGGDDDSGDRGSSGNGGGQPPTKSASDIEGEINQQLAEKPYRELIFGQVTINCPESISRNLAQGQSTECTAEDEGGSVTEFKVKSIGQGDQYEYSPGDIVSGLSF